MNGRPKMPTRAFSGLYPASRNIERTQDLSTLAQDDEWAVLTRGVAYKFTQRLALSTANNGVIGTTPAVLSAACPR